METLEDEILPPQRSALFQAYHSFEHELAESPGGGGYLTSDSLEPRTESPDIEQPQRLSLNPIQTLH